jgi:hypothetical protein
MFLNSEIFFMLMKEQLFGTPWILGPCISQALKSRKSLKAIPYPIYITGYVILKVCGQSSRCRPGGK